MSRRLTVLVAAVVVGGAGGPASAGQMNQATRGLDTALIERLTGAKGTLEAREGVFKVSVPRADLAVTAAGVRMTPPMGLTSWAAFQRAGEHTMVMGDLVLLEDQVNPVMTAALDQGLEVTALHNHFLWDTPKVMFMHIAATGDEAALASAVGGVFAKVAQTAGGKGEAPRGDVDPVRTTLDPRKIDAIVGRTGALSGGVYKVVIGRTVRMHGHAVAAAMGVNTWAAFAGSDARAAVAGDFAMLESELQGVLRALRRAGISVVAIHQHMTGEEPRMLFLHYWGLGRTEDLARALRTALDAMKHDERGAPERVVFVCEHGSVKSVVAKEWFNRLARERGLALRAVSRGMAPDPSVPPVVVEKLRQDGFDVSGFAPRALTKAELGGVERVVIIGGVDTSAVTASAGVALETWQGIPPATEQYEAARDALKARIEALLATLKGGEVGPEQPR